MQKLKIRGLDKYGAGHFGARRDGGKRTHRGVDAITVSGDDFYSRVVGTVSKLGYPYEGNYDYRYVQITDKNGWKWRYYYIKPSVELGLKINVGDKIGVCQDLHPRYPGITPHVHFEIKDGDKYIDPTNYLNPKE
jgi:murein DD-endopeptidase MepM/ murein hydrolase activator NlpD